MRIKKKKQVKITSKVNINKHSVLKWQKVSLIISIRSHNIILHIPDMKQVPRNAQSLLEYFSFYFYEEIWNLQKFDQITNMYKDISIILVSIIRYQTIYHSDNLSIIVVMLLLFIILIESMYHNHKVTWSIFNQRP